MTWVITWVITWVVSWVSYWVISWDISWIISWVFSYVIICFAPSPMLIYTPAPWLIIITTTSFHSLEILSLYKYLFSFAHPPVPIFFVPNGHNNFNAYLFLIIHLVSLECQPKNWPFTYRGSWLHSTFIWTSVLLCRLQACVVRCDTCTAPHWSCVSSAREPVSSSEHELHDGCFTLIPFLRFSTVTSRLPEPQQPNQGCSFSPPGTECPGHI